MMRFSWFSWKWLKARSIHDVVKYLGHDGQRLDKISQIGNVSNSLLGEVRLSFEAARTSSSAYSELTKAVFKPSAHFFLNHGISATLFGT